MSLDTIIIITTNHFFLFILCYFNITCQYKLDSYGTWAAIAVQCPLHLRSSGHLLLRYYIIMFIILYYCFNFCHPTRTRCTWTVPHSVEADSDCQKKKKNIIYIHVPTYSQLLNKFVYSIIILLRCQYCIINIKSCPEHN